MKISARNVIKGTVLEVNEGPVNSQVRVDIGGGKTIKAMITSDAIGDLGIAVGSEVQVVIKASDVMLGID
jgi:molybdopterin-binding protein